jgi:hypothetical protein
MCPTATRIDEINCSASKTAQLLRRGMSQCYGAGQWDGETRRRGCNPDEGLWSPAAPGEIGANGAIGVDSLC